MKIRKILLIDDGDVEQIVERLQQKLRREGIDVIVSIINPQLAQFKKMEGDEYIIDFSKLKEHIETKYSKTKFDVVGSDFNFANDKLNGYEVTRWLINESREKGFSFRNAKFICYSSEEDKFCNIMFNNKELIKLIKLNIHAFYNRKNLANDITTLVRSIGNDVSMSDYFKELLSQKPDLVFKNVYPKFKDKTLHEICTEIEKNTYHGKEFQKYMAELTYAHVIELNEE
ncbi:hypothetical protein [Photobacterium phosphoreum]|uniref:hypothetical protein n=1 Tax=Photobacterium phosphoreum TaxID=659 RepID=UPI001E56783A|nr:hypothetical protein [Photobacterium phosphoreum]MCD9506593.1 hypothetical protein [Photobacterium phosphoreum]